MIQLKNGRYYSEFYVNFSINPEYIYKGTFPSEKKILALSITKPKLLS